MILYTNMDLYNKFFTELALIKNKYKWYIINGKIRGNKIFDTQETYVFESEEECCPMAAICSEKFNLKISNNNYGVFSSVLEIPTKDLNPVLSAADCSTNIRYRIRYRILKILGLING